MCCGAHILNLIVKDGLSVIKKILREFVIVSQNEGDTILFETLYGDDAYIEIERAKSVCYALLNEYKLKTENFCRSTS